MTRLQRDGSRKSNLSNQNYMYSSYTREKRNYENSQKRQVRIPHQKQSKWNNFARNVSKRFNKVGNNTVSIILGSILGIIVIVLIIAVISSQVQLTELNQKINDAKNLLSEKQSEYTQLQMKIDANLSTTVIEKYAQEKLGMSKASNAQKEFISLSQGDKAEVTVKPQSNIFTAIGDAFSNLW